LNSEITRLHPVMKELEHQDYLVERRKQLNLSDEETKAMEPCDEELWAMDDDTVTPRCWSNLLALEFSAFARERSACANSLDCALLPGLNCPKRIAANRQYEQEIATKREELTVTLHQKRFVATTCCGELMEGVTCGQGRCVGKYASPVNE
jgi:hypothetical protein